MAGLSPWAPHAAPCPGRPGPAGLTLLLAGLRGSQAAGRAGRSQAPGRAADGGVVGVSPWALTLVGGTCVCTERGSRGPRGHEQPLPPPTCQLGTSTPGPLGRHPRSLRGRCPTPGPQPTHSHPLPFSTQKLEQEREHVGGDPEDPRVTPGKTPGPLPPPEAGATVLGFSLALRVERRPLSSLKHVHACTHAHTAPTAHHSLTQAGHKTQQSWRNLSLGPGEHLFPHCQNLYQLSSLFPGVLFCSLAPPWSFP